MRVPAPFPLRFLCDAPPRFSVSLRYLSDNFDWFEEQLASFGDDDYLILDCPGQIELYSHVNVMRRVADVLAREGFNVCGVFLVCTHPSPPFGGCWL